LLFHPALLAVFISTASFSPGSNDPYISSEDPYLSAIKSYGNSVACYGGSMESGCNSERSYMSAIKGSSSSVASYSNSAGADCNSVRSYSSSNDRSCSSNDIYSNSEDRNCDSNDKYRGAETPNNTIKNKTRAAPGNHLFATAYTSIANLLHNTSKKQNSLAAGRVSGRDRLNLFYLPASPPHPSFPPMSAVCGYVQLGRHWAVMDISIKSVCPGIYSIINL
jgi:hypothetical protein